ncbi:two-component system sensor histidine kinase NtrB [Salidesulfovibrio onnuriiensis]|uniref:two-component system sensor histidine kinase NtrB n=1 Tax=Salidesulfovibrio onnuriiensis TaxID=2583823 RepID=UPI001650AA45|nr:ATP-binding protein [Salidesulfovibrio onnuriiensis]
MVMPGYVIMQNILESIPTGILVIQPGGKIAATNQAVEKILNISEEDIMGKSWAELFIEDSDNPEFADIVVEAVQLQAVGLHRSIPYTCPDGGKLQLSVTTSYLKEEGEAFGVVLVITDDTEKHQFLTRDNRHLREIKRLQDERVQGLNKLAMAVAHQIRNPLMTIGGFGNLLLRELGENEHYASQLTTIIEEAKKMEGIVGAVRDYTSLRAANRSEVASCVLLSELEDYARKRAESEKREVDWVTACPLVDFIIDHELFVMAMTILIDNAFDFSEGPVVRIKVMVEPDEHECRITLSDRGMGIAEKDKPYLFDPFYTTKPDAVGMGLATAKRIIAEHGGTLDLNTPEVGVEAIITLAEQNLGRTDGHALMPPVIPRE